MWDARTGQELLSLKGGGDNVAFSPDGKRLASWRISTRGEVKIWDAQTGQELTTFKGHTGPVFSVAFSPDGKRLASGSVTLNSTNGVLDAGEVKVWDAQTGRELLSLKGHTAKVVSLAFSPDGKRLASGGPGPGCTRATVVKVWDADRARRSSPSRARWPTARTAAPSADKT